MGSQAKRYTRTYMVYSQIIVSIVCSICICIIEDVGTVPQQNRGGHGVRFTSSHLYSSFWIPPIIWAKVKSVTTGSVEGS